MAERLATATALLLIGGPCFAFGVGALVPVIEALL